MLSAFSIRHTVREYPHSGENFHITDQSPDRIHALESEGTGDDTKWLTYWVVYAFFGLFEFFSDMILGWFPFYWLAKVAFLVWCFNPITNGSLVVYERFIRPVFLRNQKRIDKAMSSASGAVLSQGESANTLQITRNKRALIASLIKSLLSQLQLLIWLEALRLIKSCKTGKKQRSIIGTSRMKWWPDCLKERKE